VRGLHHYASPVIGLTYTQQELWEIRWDHFGQLGPRDVDALAQGIHWWADDTRIYLGLNEVLPGYLSGLGFQVRPWVPVVPKRRGVDALCGTPSRQFTPLQEETSCVSCFRLRYLLEGFLRGQAAVQTAEAWAQASLRTELKEMTSRWEKDRANYPTTLDRLRDDG
jgi:hypothetical protein